MKLRIVLDNAECSVIERDNDRGFATWGMTLCREGFTMEKGGKHTYIPPRRIRRIELVEDDA